VLPEAFAEDAERLARFRREAQLLAALNHPHIAAIYGLEESGGVEALVLELVPGETVAERLTKGALPLEEALEIARQIAEALEAAHERGIVHRDLKPANVKLTPEGKVKVLDFGLAKALLGDASSPDVSASPTITAQATQAGGVIGTAAYMSPEQAGGKTVDKRADIWAFGVVLYEMLIGQRLFAGDSVAETLAGVFKAEIDFAALPAGTPPEIRRLLRRCLERQPKNRLHDIADARIVLDEIASGSREEDSAASIVAMLPPRWAWKRSLPWVVALLGVAFGAVEMLRLGRPHAPGEVPSSRVTRFVVMPPGPGEIDNYPALSPDGRSIVFCFAPEHGVTQLWLHSFDSGRNQQLVGTERAEQPFWSPDSRYVGFFARGQLRQVEIATGHVESVVTASDPRGATWSESGEIVFSSTCCTSLSRVASAGGAPRRLTELDLGAGEGSHRYPWALPGGEALLFTVPDGRQPGIYWLSLATGKRVFLVPEVARAAYDSRGFLLWTRNGSLAAQRFDPRTAALSGEAFVVDEHVGTDADKTAQDLFAAAAQVVAVHATSSYQRALGWVDRHGTPGLLVGSPGNFYDPALSPDGTRVAVAKSPVPNYYSSDIWIFETSARDRATRFSFAGGSTPVWSADGRTLYYAAQTAGTHRVMAKRADGGAAEEVIYSSRSALWPDDSSKREPLLVIEGNTGEGTYKLWLVPLRGEHAPRPYEQASPGSQAHATFSPDGRLLAYTSDESGQGQIYVQSVDGSPGRWQVTNDGGDLAAWRADGKELFYVGFDRVLRAVSIRSLSPFTVGETQELFALRIPQLAVTSQHSYYQPSSDGQHFLVNEPIATAIDPGLLVTLGWSPPTTIGRKP
jgi:Tol biopolymer transport system component